MKGTIVRVLADKRFGFIRGEDQKEYFFHQTDLNGFFDDLVVDFKTRSPIKVEFEPTTSDKGPRASEVRRTDLGI